MRVLLRPLVLVALLASCRTPTSVTLVLSSDVACSDHPSTSVAVSRATDETLAPALVTSVCQPDGHIGTVVVVPASRKDEDLRVRVVTSVGEGVTCAGPPYGQECIVSRRQLRFLAHEELTVPIAQQVDCAGVACEATTTCRKGTCVVAQVDVDRCQAHPDECGIELAPDPVPVAGAGGTGGVGGESGSSGQGGVAGQGGAGGAAGDTAAGAGGAAGDTSAGASGSSGASGSTGVVKPPLPPLPAGAGTGVTYYVSPKGNDSNDGKSEETPWQSLDRIAAGVFAPGDSVLLEGGGVFAGCLALTGSNVKSTAEAPFTLGAYGGKPFEIDATCEGANSGAIHLTSIDGVLVTDGVLRGSQGGTQYGVVVDNGTGQPLHGTRIQRCDIGGFHIDDKVLTAAEVFFNGFGGGFDGVMVLDSELHGVDGQDSADENGVLIIGPDTSVTGVLFQGLDIRAIGGKAGDQQGNTGNGIVLSSTEGAVVQYNVIHDSGGNTTLCGGPAGIQTYRSKSVIIQYNEIYGMGPGGKPAAGACGWSGYSLADGVTGSVVRYNYSHENRGAGFFGYVAEGWSGNVYRHNISQNDAVGMMLAGDSDVADVDIHHNTLFTSGDALPLLLSPTGTASFTGHIVNNLLVASGTAVAVQATLPPGTSVVGLALRRNDYRASEFVSRWGDTAYTSLGDWAAATGQETVGGQLIGLTVDPQLASPGGGGIYGGYDPDGLSDYRLLPGSPLRGAGLDPKTLGIEPGATDYYGQAIPHTIGSGYNVGADGAP